MKTRLIPIILLLGLSWQFSFAQWETIATGVFPSNHRIWSIKMVDNSTIWAISGYDGFPPPISESPVIYRSVDGGATWQTSVVVNTGGKYGWDVAAINSTTAFAALDYKGFYRTQDGGATWERFAISDSIPIAYIVHFFNEAEGFFFGTKLNNHTTVGVTKDGGATWSIVPAAKLPAYKPSDCFVCYNYATNSAYSEAGNMAVIAATNGSYWLSRDKGSHWERVETPFAEEGHPIVSIAIKDSATVMIATNQILPNTLVTPHVLTTTDNWQTWVESSPYVTPAALRYVPGSDSIFVMVAHSEFGGTRGTSITYDLGKTWRYLDNTRLIALDFLDKNNAMAGLGAIEPWGSSGEVYRWNLAFASPAKEQLEPNQLRLSPNPAARFLRIELPETTNTDFELQAFDAQGKLLEQLPFIEKQVVDVQGLSPGVYTLKSVVGHQIYTGKFVKL